jgi:hypothetical protein
MKHKRIDLSPSSSNHHQYRSPLQHRHYPQYRFIVIIIMVIIKVLALKEKIICNDGVECVIKLLPKARRST